MAGSRKRIAKVNTCNTVILSMVQRANSYPQELSDITKSPPSGMIISLISESDIHKWQILMDGPDKSPYMVSFQCGLLCCSFGAHLSNP